jgi:hypothetical protein
MRYARDLVRGFDEGLLLAASYAPKEKQDGLIALYAFAAELDRIPASVSEPPLGEIRLQWWRDALDEVFGEGEVRAHPVVEVMRDGLRGAGLPRLKDDLLALIEAHAPLLSMTPFADEAELVRFFRATRGHMMCVAARWLVDESVPEEALQNAGAVAAIVQKLIAPPETLSHGKGVRQVQTPREKLGDFASKAGAAGMEKILQSQLAQLTELDDQPAALMPVIASFSLIRGDAARAIKAMNTGELPQKAFGALHRRWKLLRTVMSGKV